MINKQILSLFKLNNDDYLIWCANNGLTHYLRETKKMYYDKILKDFLEK